MMSYGLELVYGRLSQRSPNIVCVHGYGTRPESTWHHEESGKTWINDSDFLSLLKGPVRVFNFHYNGDVAANLSAASLAFHANDLLSGLQDAIGKNPGGPIIFVAHSWGGIVVKKAIQLCCTTTLFASIRPLIGGVVFFGTPHTRDNSAALLEAMKETIEGFSRIDHTIPESDIREYVSAVSTVNTVFARCKSPTMKMISYWETEPTEILPAGKDSYSTIIMSQQCICKELVNNLDNMMDTDHPRMPCFPNSFDKRFIQFQSDLHQMVSDAFATVDPLLYTAKHASGDDTDGNKVGSRPPKPPKRTRKRKKSPVRRTSPAPMPVGLPHVDPNVRVVRQPPDKESCDRFLRSLKGWSEENTGSNYSAALGTCEWYENEPPFTTWDVDPHYGTMFCVGDAGQGKSHIVRSIVEHLKAVHPTAIVMSFHCTPGEGRPPIWEYFTWTLISNHPSWFAEVPHRYQDRDENSPPLSLGAFVEIWQEFRRAGSYRDLYLLIDGLEKCGEDRFAEFFACVEPLRHSLAAPQSNAIRDRPRGPTRVKIHFSCRRTPAVMKSQVSCTWKLLGAGSTAGDIAKYVDGRLDKLFSDTKGLWRLGHHSERLSTLKEDIKELSVAYWPYAKHAVEEVEQCLPQNDDIVFDLDGRMPYGLRRKYDLELLPRLQSVDNESGIRSVVTLLASFFGVSSPSIAVIEDMMAALYPDKKVQEASLAQILGADFSDIFILKDGTSVAFVHTTMRNYLKGLLSDEQRNANMAFVCLRYLLKDLFSTPLRLDSNNFIASRSWLSDTHPFYTYAANHWSMHLRESRQLGIQLIPLIRQFLNSACCQYRTWCHWKNWYSNIPREADFLQEPLIMPLVYDGCVDIIQHLVSLGAPSRIPSSDNRLCWQHAMAYLGMFIPSVGRDKDPLVARWPHVTSAAGQSLLVSAVRSCRLDMVKFVLDCGHDVNARSSSGVTALASCFVLPMANEVQVQLDVVTELLRRGADPNIGEDLVGDTCLYLAAMSGRLKTVQKLLDYGALTEVSPLGDSTILERTLGSKNKDVLLELVRAGADVDVWSSYGLLPLGQCIIEQDMGAFHMILPMANVNLVDMHGYSLIHMVSDWVDRLEFLRALLTRPDLDLDVVDNSFPSRLDRRSRNALTMAASNKNYAAMELLLQAGAHPGPLPGMSITPLHYAARKMHLGMAELLLSYQAPVNAFTKLWYAGTPLGVAVDKGDETMVALLLKHGADPTVAPALGANSPLWLAVRRESPRLNIVKMLLEASVPADMNAVEEKEDHALAIAAKAGNVEVVRLLLDHGADLNLWLPPSTKMQHLDISPLHLAAVEGHVEVCSVLLERESRLLDAQFEQGFQLSSPLFCACESGRHEVVKFLLERGARLGQANCHYGESVLLGACASGNYETVALILDAAPELLNAGCTIYGRTPLFYVSDKDDLRILELLLEAGADMHIYDRSGKMCIAYDLIGGTLKRPDKAFQLYLKHGYDINQVCTQNGLTLLGTAIWDGTPREVRWLLEKGADPIRAQRSPTDDSLWRNALHIACMANVSAKSRKIFDMLLEPQWGLREQLAHQDWFGQTPLASAVFEAHDLSKGYAIATTCIWETCEEIRTETSHDLFAEIMAKPTITGLSPLDYILGRRGCTPQAQPGIDRVIAGHLKSLLARPRSPQAQLIAVQQIVNLLTRRPGYESLMGRLMEMDNSLPSVELKDDGYEVGTELRYDCDGCHEHKHSGSFFGCCRCRQGRCGPCKDKPDELCAHKHKWIELKPISDADWNSDETQAYLEEFYEAVTTSLASEGQEMMDNTATNTDSVGHLNAPPQRSANTENIPPEIVDEIGVRRNEDQDQGSWQLAMLHALNFLAVRRPLFTPYLPLSAHADALIAPWRQALAPWRRFVERDNLAYETSGYRRWQESAYIRRWLGTRYADADLARRNSVIESIGVLFQREEEDDDGGAHDDSAHYRDRNRVRVPSPDVNGDAGPFRGAMVVEHDGYFGAELHD